MVKILLCGQVHGQWDLVFERVQKLNAAAKSAPFQVLLCVGRAFPFPVEYLDGTKHVPIPTYFVSAFEDDGEDVKRDAKQAAVYEQMVQAGNGPVEVAKNLFFLGKQGITTVCVLVVV